MRRKYLDLVLLIFVSLLLSILLTYPVYAYSTIGGHWQPSHVGLRYNHLPADWRNVVYNSRMTWNNVGTGMYIWYDANSPFWVTVAPYGDVGWFGATYVPVAGGWIADAQVYINSSFCVPRDPNQEEIDGQSIVTHELGHFDGLDHSISYAATMFGDFTDYWGQIFRRNLEPDDSGGLHYMYPGFYRLYNGVEHYYTTDIAEKNALIGQGWIYEGVACWAWGHNFAGEVRPFWRLYNGVDHFYTIHDWEVAAAQAAGYWLEGVATYVLETQQLDVIPLYRLYNGVDHFYTASVAERDALIGHGWSYEGVAAYVRYR